MEKIMRIGTVKTYDGRDASIFIKAEFENGKFSMSGVIGPLSNGDALGGCGQINMEFDHRNKKDNDDRYSELITPDKITFADGWNAEKFYDLLDVWEKWHLNDMKAGCEHQMEKWDIGEKVELIEWKWSDKFHNWRENASDGKLTPENYRTFQIVSAQVLQVTISSPIKWESPLVKKLLADGWIKEGKKEIKTAGWIDESEHPKGLLMKACPECGYKYGSAWLKVDVPPEIIAQVESWPNADRKPAWI